jgi:Rho guanine nucleotide exchange factor 4/29
MKDHPEVFSLESVFLMFSNIEQINRFQQNFLEALRIAIPNGRIGEVFLDFQSAFMVYSQYCNSYPRALMELENFSSNKEAISILERYLLLSYKHIDI